MLDFQNTRISLDRPWHSYSKVRQLISPLVRNRRAFWKPLKDPLYLDIGCAEKTDQDFYSIDCEWHPGIDRCMDITRGLFLPDNSVSGVFTEHCLEHIEFAQAVRVLEELYQAMKPGSVLRIVVPDAELHARAYLKSLETGRKVVPFADSIEKSGLSTPVMSINECMRGHGHRFICDVDTLTRVCSRIGFQECGRVEFMKGRDEKLLRDSPERRVESLYFEAIR